MKALLTQRDDTWIVMELRHPFSAEDRYVKILDRMKVELDLLIIMHDQLLWSSNSSMCGSSAQNWWMCITVHNQGTFKYWSEAKQPGEL